MAAWRFLRLNAIVRINGPHFSQKIHSFKFRAFLLNVDRAGKCRAAKVQNILEVLKVPDILKCCM